VQTRIPQEIRLRVNSLKKTIYPTDKKKTLALKPQQRVIISSSFN